MMNLERATLLSIGILLSVITQASAQTNIKLTQAVKDIESDWQGRIGVYAYDINGSFTFGYRESERFPLCSSFKSLLAAAILQKSQNQLLNLNTPVDFSERELEFWSPITKENHADGMTIGQLAQAALQYSDNGATNILLERYVGGPKGMNTFMKSIGDEDFRLDRWELELNTAIPGDERDTSTPKSMARSLGKLSFSNVLSASHRELFHNWLIGNTTGDNRIRAAVPNQWQVGDKTGTCGAYGAASDVAVIWREKASPLVIAIYTHKSEPTAKHSDKIIAEVAKETLKYIIN